MNQGMFGRETSLHSIAEELYFWLMRSTSAPKDYADTFRVLSQIMRISQVSSQGGKFLQELVELEAYDALSHIKEQLMDGKLHVSSLFPKVELVLKKLIQDNTKAILVANATELEYIFCIQARYNSAAEAKYQQKFKEYLTALVDKVNGDLSETQAKGINQALRQVLQDPMTFSNNPHKKLIESLEQTGLIIIDIRPHEVGEEETA